MTYLKNKIILIVVIILLVIAGVYYFSRREKSKDEAEDLSQKVDAGINYDVDANVGDVGKGTENALKNMPATNPLEEVANPFRDAYKNPFE